MALKDSFINLNKALRTTLQNVPAVVDTLIRGFYEIGDAADELTTCSTDEHVVGKWIDGSDVYEKLVVVPTLANTGLTSVDVSSLNIAKMLYMNGVAKSTGYTIPLPCAYSDGSSFTGVGVYYNYSAKDIRIDTFSDRSSYTDNYLIIRYIKAPVNRASKENDTKNAIDDEPVVKTVEDPDVKTVEEPAEELKK